MLSVIIDFRMCNSSGIGTYIRNIVPFLIEKFDITLLGDRKEINTLCFSAKVKMIDCSSNIYSIKEQIELASKIPKSDIFWSPHYNIPLLPIKAKKRVVTIHDVFHLNFFDQLSLKQKVYAKLVINQAVKRSDKILTVSTFSADEIKKHTSTTKEIDIVYNAIDFSLFKKIEKETVFSVVKKYGLPSKYILFVGNVKPHKNIKNLLLAIKDTSINIVIVGKREGFITGDNDISNLIQNNEMSNRVFFTGYVDEQDLPAIYSGSELFIFPSFYEGFGIPPLEAQACGCPVVCSNVASLPEVGGDDSVMYCNPYDVDDIRNKIELVLNDNLLQKELIEKGFENIKRFSWEKSAKEVIELIERLK